jgi:hypothetical protein
VLLPGIASLRRPNQKRSDLFNPLSIPIAMRAVSILAASLVVLISPLAPLRISQSS